MTPLADAVRHGLRRMAASVTVVTTEHAGERIGMTATSVCSVAMEPPSMLVCIERTTRMYRAVTEARRFCINVLRDHHEPLCFAFATLPDCDERFAHGTWGKAHGLPYLEDAQVNLFLDVVQITDHGTHGIAIGDVTEVRFDEAVEPLLYVDGATARLALPQ